MNNVNRAAQAEERLARVSEMYLAGESMRAISAALKIGLATVFRDLRKAHELWTSRAVHARDKLIQRELATLDWIELEATRAWLRSIGKYEIVTVKNTTVAGSMPDDADIELPADERTVKTEHLAGDPRFLETMRGCVADRRKLMGLDAPVRTLIGNDGDAPFRVLKVVDVGRPGDTAANR